MLKRAPAGANHGGAKRRHSMMRAEEIRMVGEMQPSAEQRSQGGAHLQSAKSRKTVKDTRAKNRNAKFVQPSPKKASCQPTFLESQNITQARGKTYTEAWSMLKRFAKENKLPMKTLNQVDTACAWAIDDLYFKGDSISAAMTLMAAVRQNRTDVPKLSTLVRSTRAMRGFKKMAPGQSRVPLPFPMLCQIAITMIQQLNQPLVALWLVLTWSVCCRPGEAMKLTPAEIVAPNHLCNKWSVLLSASSSHEGQSLPSKTGDLDENVLIDQPFLRWLGPILRHVKSQKSPSLPFFPFSMNKAAEVFSKAVDECGYRKHGIQCSYQVRHGSASTDILTNMRSIEALMKRGRWKSLSSLRRYEQGGRIAQVFSKAEQAAAINAEKQLPNIMARSVGCSKSRGGVFSWSSSPGLVE